MAKHTAGPWEIGEGEMVWAANEQAVACMMNVFASQTEKRVPKDERRANGRLIESAPSLFEALETIASIQLSGGDYDVNKMKLDVAITTAQRAIDEVENEEFVFE